MPLSKRVEAALQEQVAALRAAREGERALHRADHALDREERKFRKHALAAAQVVFGWLGSPEAGALCRRARRLRLKSVPLIDQTKWFLDLLPAKRTLEVTAYFPGAVARTPITDPAMLANCADEALLPFVALLRAGGFAAVVAAAKRG